MWRAGRHAWPWAALPIAAVLAVDPGGLAPFGPIKWMVVPALVLTGIAATGVRPTRDWALPAFVGWTALTAAFGLDRIYAWTGTPERHLGVIAWLLVLACWWRGRTMDRGAMRLVLAACAAAVGALGLWAAAESLGWRPINLVGIGDRPVGTLGSSAFLGAAAALLNPIALGWSMQLRGRPRLLAFAASGLGVVAIAASGARAAFLGIAVAGFIAMALAREKRLALRVGAVCAVAIIGLTMATGSVGRIARVMSDSDGGAQGRVDEWRVALRVVADHPVLGTGPEGYRIAFGQAVDETYEQEHGRNPLPDRAHSALLDVAATTGFVGLALYLAALAFALRAAVRAIRNGPPILAGAAVGVIAYFTQSLFLFPIAELEPVAWLLAGLCTTSGWTSSPPRAPSSPRSRAPRALAGAVAVVALVTGALDVVSDRRAKDALRDVAADVPSRHDVAALRPDQVRYWLVDARSHQATGSLLGMTRALADLDHALDVSPRDPVARREKAGLLIAIARRTQSPDDAVTAADYLALLAHDDPRNAEVLLRLGLARDLKGDADGAIEAWLQAERLAPRSAAASANLAVAYAKAGRRAEAEAAAARALRRDPSNATARTVLAQLKDGT